MYHFNREWILHAAIAKPKVRIAKFGRKKLEISFYGVEKYILVSWTV